MARVRAGDDRAFEALYDRHHRPLLAFCRHLLGSADEAEDALQHTFIAAHRALRTDERPVMLRPWLFTIARNRCLSLLRSRRNVVALTDVEPTLPVTVGLAAQVEQRADLQALVHDLHALSDDQRAALVLSELGDLDHEQIANVLGVRRARVATLVFQARASLMETRKARDTSCSDIQEQLATLRGGALRRTTLRRHVESCTACQAFRAEVRRQRAAMALILPVIPSLGLKRSVLHAISSGGGAAGAAAAAGGVSGGIAILGGSGAAGTGAVAGSAAVASSAAVVAAPAATATAVAAVTSVSAGVAASRRGRRRGRRRCRGREGARRQGPHRRGGRQRRHRPARGGRGSRRRREAASHAGRGHRADAVGRHVRPGDRGREGRGLEGRRHRARRRLLLIVLLRRLRLGFRRRRGGRAPPRTTADSSASETGSGAGAMPGEVIDDGASTSPPADTTPPRDPAPAETTPADPPPAETTPADPAPAETTPAADPPPAATTSTPDPPPATTPADPPPAQTTTTEEPAPPADQGSGSGDGDPDDGPVATGASVDMPEPPPAEPTPVEVPPAA